MLTKKAGKKYIYLFLSIYLFISLFQKINLTTADLGRHIKNGEIILKTLNIPKINLYSYTHPNFLTINHHWGFGIISYILYKIGSFEILNIFYSLLISIGIYLLFNLSKNILTSIFSFFITFPLLIYRKEIRPEGFSYLFLSTEIYLIEKFKKGEIPFKKFLVLYLLIELFWTNLHIFFPFGLSILGFAIIESFFQKNWQLLKKFTTTLLASSFITLINPYFIKGALQPFLIFKNYGYTIAENQSIFFAIKRLPSFTIFYTVFTYLVFLSIALIYRKSIKKNLLIFLSTLFFLILSLKFIRAIPLFGILFFIFALKTLEKTKTETMIFLLSIFIFFIIFTFPFTSIFFPFKNPAFGIGLLPGNNASAEFFKKLNLSGPIFNNYDIGSYLIFHFYPKEKVFVDNRPEAYPAEFFKEEYIAAQENEKVWRKLQQKYNFNVIYFYRHDATPWAQPFLIRRINDKNWIPIYVDAYTLILIKNNKQNQKIIQKYQLPNSIFKISKN